MIRRYEKGDFESVHELNYECYDAPVNEPDLDEALEEGTTWIYTEHGKVYGVIVTTIDASRPYIFSITVHKDMQGKGVGKKLLLTAERFYRKQRFAYIWLHVATNNAAQKLYFDVGYRAKEVIPDYYDIQDDAMVMIRKLL